MLEHLIVVPPVEEDPHHKEGWVLVGPESDKMRHPEMASNMTIDILLSKIPGVPKQVHPLGVELGEQMGGRGVLHRDPHAVQGRHPLLLAPLHLQGPILKAPHSIHPGLLCRISNQL